MIPLILMVFGFVLFMVAFFNIAFRWNLIAAGLAFWILAEIFMRAGSLMR